MPNATQTVRPTSVEFNAGNWFTAVGAANIQTATSDNTDSSYANANAFPPNGVGLELRMGTFTLPAGAQIRSVTPRLRFSGGSFNQSFFLRTSTKAGSADTSVGSNPPIATYAGAALTTHPDGSAWTQSDINNLIVGKYTSNLDDGNIRIYEAYADIAYNRQPTVTSITPSGTVTTTAQPTIGWTWTDADGDLQERFQVKIYQGTGTVSNPDTTTAYVESGVVFSGTSSWTPAQTLPAGAYRVYVKASDVGSNGRYSAWDTQTFTIQIDAPATPTITAVADSTLARIGLTINGRDNLLTANQASLETDTTGWAVDVNSTIARSTAQAANGSASLLMSSSAAGTMSARTLAGTGGVPVAANTQYTALASFRAASTGRSVSVGLSWYTSSGTLIGSVTYGTAATSTTSGWTQVSYTTTSPATAAYATLFVQVASTGAASEQHYVDQISLAPGASTTWTAGGRTASSTVVIERSTDGGTTWTTVRGGAAAAWASTATQTISLYDYELRRDTSAIYRARVTATSPYSASSAYAQSSSVSHAATGWWLKDPLSPGLNMQIEVAPGFEIKQKKPQSVFEPIGRNVSVVISDGVRGIEGQLEVWAKSQARYDKVMALIQGGRVLWLEDVFGRAWYISIGDAIEVSLLRAKPQWGEDSPIRHLHSVNFSFTEVGAPTSHTITAGTPTDPLVLEQQTGYGGY